MHALPNSFESLEDVDVTFLHPCGIALVVVSTPGHEVHKSLPSTKDALQ